ncbi:MAG: pyrimidine/purine nucleoside phosphorylase [bacterium]|nr:pyrimidine/purine nucleoside phosphorylase [bacterium]
MIKVNEYFDGNVKSLADELKGETFSVGIIEPGEYTFGTATEELMEVTHGQMDVDLPDGSKITCKKGESFTVPANKEFKATATEPVSYLCIYK